MSHIPAVVAPLAHADQNEVNCIGFPSIRK